MPTSTIQIPRPAAGEFLPYYERYIDLVSGDDALAPLRGQIVDTLAILGRVSEADSQKRYQPGKWSVRQLVNHMSDCERVMSYRALRIARGDTTPLPGFDENHYAAEAGSDRRTLAEIAQELRIVRDATLALFGSLDPATLTRVGKANDAAITPRALGWIIAGHELHHRNILRERYGVA